MRLGRRMHKRRHKLIAFHSVNCNSYYPFFFAPFNKRHGCAITATVSVAFGKYGGVCVIFQGVESSKDWRMLARRNSGAEEVKMIKKLMMLAAGFVFAAVVAAIVVPMFINPNNFRAAIIHQLEDATGYAVRVDGDLSIQLLPFARISARKIMVKSRAEAENDPFIKAGAIDIGVELFPLLSGIVEVRNLTLKEPVITLKQYPRGNNWRKGGRNNYDYTVPPSSVTDEPELDFSGSTPQSILLRDIEIIDGVLQYTNQVSGTKITLTNLDLDAGMDSMASPFTVKAEAVWNSKPVELKIKLGALGEFLANKKVPLEALFESDLAKVALTGQMNKLNFSGEIGASSDSVMMVGGWLTGKQAQAGVKPMALTVKGKMECSPIACGVAKSDIVLDGQKLTGDAKVEMHQERPMLQIDLAAPALDLTPYVQKNKSAGMALIGSAYAAEAPWSAAALDLSALNFVNGNFSLVADKLIANKFEAGKLVVRAKIDRGTLSADVVSADLYQGSGRFSGSLSVEGRADGLVVIDGVQLKPFFVGMADSDRFSGRGNARVAFKTRGKSEKEMVGNLTGDGTIKILDGSVKGVDIASMVRNVKSAFTVVDTAPRQTDFTEAGGNFTIAGGVITNNDLAMKAPLFRVGGKGNVDLPAYRIDYLLTPEVVETLTGQGGKDKRGISVPVRITGALDDPRYAPDLSGVVQEAIKDPEALKKNLKENLGGVKSLLKDGKALLKGL